MGLSISEFRAAMETFGAERLSDRTGTRYDVTVPCFKVGEAIFLHSGSYYIVNRGKEVPHPMMEQAMAEFGEMEPGGDNYWYNEIHSVKGILALAAMLEHRYSKELINELTNETYKKLLSSLNTHPIGKATSISDHSPKMQELYQVLMEYDKVVNPYGNPEFSFRDPIEYMDEIVLKIVADEDYTDVNLDNNDFPYVCFHSDSEGWTYSTNGWNDPVKRGDGGITAMTHYYENGVRSDSVDEIVCLEYLSGGGFEKRTGDIDLRISLKTGLAWETYEEKEAKLATDEQIGLMITYLKKCIDRAQKNIIDKMIIEKA